MSTPLLYQTEYKRHVGQLRKDFSASQFKIFEAAMQGYWDSDGVSPKGTMSKTEIAELGTTLKGAGFSDSQIQKARAKLEAMVK